jgi:hypothetical protein
VLTKYLGNKMMNEMAGYMACMRDRIGAYWIWWGGLRERAHLEDLGIKGRILLNCNLKKWDWEAWTGLI